MPVVKFSTSILRLTCSCICRLLDKHIEQLTCLVSRCQTPRLHHIDPGLVRQKKKPERTIDRSLLDDVLINNCQLLDTKRHTGLAMYQIFSKSLFDFITIVTVILFISR